MAATSYTWVGESRVGYAALGEGHPLLWFPASSSHLDLMMQHEPMRLMFEALAEFAQVIAFDHRGFGVSDAFDGTDDEWPDASVEDALAVMDALDVTQTDVLVWDVGAAALRLAALHPNRVRRIVTINSCARYLQGPDYPFGPPLEWLDVAVDYIGEHWGTGKVFALMEPWVASHPDLQAWWGLWERSAGSPARQQRAYRRHLQVDAREVVGMIGQPALVLHASNDPLIESGHGRWLNERLPDSRYVEFESSGHVFFYEHRDLVVGHVLEFLTGAVRAEADRTVSTVLFTDIVASTDRVAARGDSAWASVLDDHDSLAARVVEDHHGRLVKTTGDGVLAVFPSPGNAIRAVLELRGAVTGIGLEIRAGLHIGEVELRGEDVAGLTVHVAARVQALAGGNEIFVTRTLLDVVAGSPARFEERGTHTLKGVPRTWELFALET